MKHIFVVNPKSGKGAYAEVLKKLKAAGIKHSVYVTKAPGDASVFARDYCRAHNEKVRFHACGGDGTVREIAEGIFGFEQAELSCYPCGTGNDLVRYYGGSERFLDVEKLISAKAEPIDLIRVGSHLSVNTVNFGLDANVAKMMPEFKNKFFIGNRNAYMFALVKALITSRDNLAEIYADGERIDHGGHFLLCAAANGRYDGGGVKCAPHAENNDGLMDVCMMIPLTVPEIFKIFPSYTKGEYLDIPEFKKYSRYRRCKKLYVKLGSECAVCLDGEVLETKEFECEIIHNAINFAIPD